MPSELTAFKEEVRAASRDELLEIAADLNNDCGCDIADLFQCFIYVVYEWDLDDSTGIGRLRTNDELRAMLIEEYDELLKLTDGMDDDGESDAPVRHDTHPSNRNRENPSCLQD